MSEADCRRLIGYALHARQEGLITSDELRERILHLLARFAR
jgi:hypothetical protein